MRTAIPSILALILLLTALSASIVTACGGDDDDETVSNNDDTGSSGDDDATADDDTGDDTNDDNADDDQPYYCGADRDCHFDYLDCLIDCDNLDCLETCEDDYFTCLSDDGCVEPQLHCYDQCRSDHSDPTSDGYWNCVAGCDGDASDCFVVNCDADGSCLDSCYATARSCKRDCGPLAIGCLTGCATDLYLCVDECFLG